VNVGCWWQRSLADAPKRGVYPIPREVEGGYFRINYAAILQNQKITYVNKELRVLVVEDIAADVVMINHELRKSGIAFRSKRVKTREDYLRELEDNPPDLIFSDHSVPSFDGFAALRIAKERCPDVPFIFVTGWAEQELLSQMIQRGATDYVSKSRLSNLAPAVVKAMHLVEERALRKEIEHALHKSERRYQQLVELCPDALLVQSDEEIVFANSAAARLLGAQSVARLIGKPLKDVVHPKSWEKMQRHLRQLREEGTTFFWKSAQDRMQRLEGDVAVVPFIKERLVGVDGRVVDVEIAAAPLTFQDRPSVQLVARDITSRRHVAGSLKASKSGGTAAGAK
jgi:PAS domain S-box-containing protein